MKILVAPSAYKGTLEASRIAASIRTGLLQNASLQNKFGVSNLEIDLAPIADGGDDTLTCISLHGGELIGCAVCGPTSQTIEAAYLKIGNLACIELARASGIAYLDQSKLAPLAAHTYGVGQLVKQAIKDGAREVVIFLGGSASTDGGAGALAALGARFVDVNGTDIARGGGALGAIDRIYLRDLVSNTAGVRFYVATDVTNVLCGSSGAASVFAPQKGASAQEVELLDHNLAYYAAKLAKACADERGENSADRCNALTLAPGAGAAGGAGFGLAAALDAEIISGFHWLAQRSDLINRIKSSDMIFVAEGALDSQSLGGKANGEILSAAESAARPVVAIVASSNLGVESERFCKIIEAAKPPYATGLATYASIEAAARMLNFDDLI